MSKWKMFSLNDVCSLITDGTHQTPQYAEKGYIFLSSKNVTSGKIDWEDIKYIPEKLHNQLYSRIAPQIGDVLLAKNGTTGVAAVVDKDCVFDIYVSLALLRPKDVILSEYLLYAINNPITKRKFNRELKGIGVPNLHLKNIRETTISLPPLETQKQIAQTLDTATELLVMRKQQFAELDNLIKSTFYDMFGDPVANEKGWEVKRLSELVSKLGDGLHGTPEYSDDGEYYFINGNNLNDGTISVSNTTKKVSADEYEKYKKDLNLNTMFISINGTLGNVAFYNNEKIILGKSACYFNVFDFVNKKYLYYIFRSDYFLKYALDSATGSTIKNVSLKSMREFPIPYPPTQLQIQFTEIVTKIEEQKALVKKAIDETQYLFDSLMSEYFE